MAKHYLWLTMLLCLQNLCAQKEANIWYFGQNAGLDFNSGTPVPLLNGALNTNEGVASIADADGNLLFYTDGLWVYNKDHALMANGSNLAGNSSSSQSAIIVPRPMSDTVYYIFTVTLKGWAGGLNYSEVDMALEGGLGAVTANKNIPLLGNCTEQITAVLHANGTDIWVITHGYGNNAFHAYLVTAAGVAAAGVTSNSGLVFPATPEGTVGCMKASPQGTKIATCTFASGAQVLDLDTETGMVGTPLTLTTALQMYGVEFSPSGDVLYTSNENSGRVIQYDLTAENVAATATVVLTDPPGTGTTLQLGPDGRIYKALWGQSALSVINDPDIAGQGCSAAAGAVPLGGQLSAHGLPSFIQSYFANGIRARHLCLGEATQFELLSPVAPNAILWDFGDGTTSALPEPEHTYAAAGTYTVSATATFNGAQRLVQKNITIHALPVAHTPPDLYGCDDGAGHAIFGLRGQDEAVLGQQTQGLYTITYHSSLSDAENGAAALPDAYTNTANPQTVYVRITANISGCHAVTMFTLNVLPLPEITMPATYHFCEGGTATITAPGGFDRYEWSTGETTRSIIVGRAGSYTVTVTQLRNGTPCHATVAVEAIRSEKPRILTVTVNDWTLNNNSIAIEASGTGNRYSLDGIQWQESPVFTGLAPGMHMVHVKDAHDCGRDTREVVLLMYPRFFTPNGDGENETWHIMHSRFEEGMLVHVYDRYGKIITSLRAGGPGWDGTLNGQRLPATDYWFVAVRPGGKTHRGHFAMLR